MRQAEETSVLLLTHRGFLEAKGGPHSVMVGGVRNGAVSGQAMDGRRPTCNAPTRLGAKNVMGLADSVTQVRTSSQGHLCAMVNAETKAERGWSCSIQCNILRVEILLLRSAFRGLSDLSALICTSFCLTPREWSCGLGPLYPEAQSNVGGSMPALWNVVVLKQSGSAWKN